MFSYNAKLKSYARNLRINQTEAEKLLWFRIRRKQFQGIQFYRQKPIGNYIVDFYAPGAKLVIEVDGSQHAETNYALRDSKRDAYLASLGLRVLRFDNLQILTSLDAVLEVVWQALYQAQENPPARRC